jgi:hypothetical protein
VPGPSALEIRLAVPRFDQNPDHDFHDHDFYDHDFYFELSEKGSMDARSMARRFDWTSSP